jgi:hypothetical protein
MKIPWFLMVGNKLSPSTYPSEFSFLQAGKNPKKKKPIVNQMCESMFEKENLQMGQVKISIRIFRLKTQNFILFLFIHLFIYLFLR